MFSKKIFLFLLAASTAATAAAKKKRAPFAGWAWGPVTRGCIHGGDGINTKQNFDSLEKCMAACEKISEFVCRSVEFREADQICNFNEDDFASADPGERGFASPCIAAEADIEDDARTFRYVERKEMKWSDVKEGCIVGHDGKIVEDVDELSDCLDACATERGFTCMSVDFDPSAKTCKLSKEDHVTAGRAMTKKCREADGVLYLERVPYATADCKELSHNYEEAVRQSCHAQLREEGLEVDEDEEEEDPDEYFSEQSAMLEAAKKSRYSEDSGSTVEDAGGRQKKRNKSQEQKKKKGGSGGSDFAMDINVNVNVS